MYYTYIIRCEDNTLYTGITIDIDRRVEEHKSKNEKCAKYTKRHTFKKLEAVWKSEDRKQASKLEFHLKRLSKPQKESLIVNEKSLSDYLSEKLDSNNYKKII